MKILYVEDDHVAKLVAKNVFLRSDHELLMCQSVEDADKIVSLYSDKLDVIILDLNLDGLSGVELLRILREKCIDIP